MKLLATDLDRTLLPNGLEPDDNTLPLLSSFVERHQIVMAYVTARRVSSVLNSVMPRYQPPVAKFIIGAVGAELFVRDRDGTYREMTAWRTFIQANSPLWNPLEVKESVAREFPLLELQPEKEQTDFKISYYLYDLSLFESTQKVLTHFFQQQYDGSALVTCSIDLNAGLAYVDITPMVVTKIGALQFLMNAYEIGRDEVLFAGDSGNDLSVFLSSLDSVVVANAERAIKEQVQREKKEGALFLAQGVSGLNGNYSSGILEGLVQKGWISTLMLSEGIGG